MTPREYEKYVGTIYAKKGYDVSVSPLSNDWGIDVIAVKGEEKIGVQAKMYGNINRKVNRRAIMELYGAAAYQDCTKAVLATGGEILPDAKKVAEKLGIEILYTSAPIEMQQRIEPVAAAGLSGADREIPSFYEAWEKYIFPLKGQTLYNSRGSNSILDVDWSGIRRKTINGRTDKVDIEGFRLAYNVLVRNNGIITRDYIDQQYDKKCSSIIVVVLSQIPYVDKTSSPIGLRINKESLKH